MNERLNPYNEKMEKTIRVLEGEFATTRAGRANPAVLDKITVDYYGTPTPGPGDGGDLGGGGAHPGDPAVGQIHPQADRKGDPGL